MVSLILLKMKEIKNEQYFPTYKFKERDIALIEFEEANRIANKQSYIYGQLSSILFAICTLFIPFLWESFNDDQKLMMIKNNLNWITFFFTLIGAILLRYFCDLQQQITYNSRKVVTLRTMLGLDYGSIQMTLPRWRIEGANNPFNIKFFNGWFSFQTLPFYVITVTVEIICYLSVKDNNVQLPFNITVPSFIVLIAIPIIYILIFRKNLLDKHESLYLKFVQLIALIFRLKILPDIENIIYRAKLAYIETDRLNIDYSYIEKYLVDIEDKKFYTNKKGFSFKSLIRAFFSQWNCFNAHLEE